MTIRINQTPIDFTLESEATYSDVYRSLQAWAKAENLVILSALADGKALPPEDNTSIEVLQTVELEVVPVAEEPVGRLEIMVQFFTILGQASLTEEPAVADQLHQEYPLVRSALFPLLSPVEPRLVGPLAILDGPWDDEQKIQTAALRMASGAEVLRKELTDPGKAVGETLQDLEARIPGLERLPGIFQKGHDRDGLDLILELFTLLDDLGRRVAAYGRQGADLSEWTPWRWELQPFLKEAGDALEASDFILLTDLLEYEVAPRLKTIKDFFPETRNLDPASGVL